MLRRDVSEAEGQEKGKCGHCQPDCAGRACDPDGCGGQCGLCSAGTVCSEGRQCLECDVCGRGCAHATVQAAVNAAADGATVRLCPGTYHERVATYWPGVPADFVVALTGAGSDPGATVLRGDSEALHVESGHTVYLRNLTVTGAGGGSAVINDGNLALNSVQVTDCVTTSAITNRGILDLEDSLVRGNSGRGIANTDGTVTLVRSHVEGNRSETGAGIHNTRGDVVLIDGSAVTGNTATGDDGPFGGGILNFAGAVAIDGTSVVSGNAPDQCVDLGGGRGCP